jgi:hypothetical protein
LLDVDRQDGIAGALRDLVLPDATSLRGKLRCEPLAVLARYFRRLPSMRGA